MDINTLEKFKKEAGEIKDFEDFKTVMGKIIIENEINLTRSLIKDITRIIDDRKCSPRGALMALRDDLKKGVELLKTF